MVIKTNTHALAAASNLQASESMLGKSLARLSSGSKIVNPAEDAAGLVSMRLDATIGAYQARMNLTSEQLVVSKENLSAATSRIQDVDVAEESTQYARYNILVQSGTAMLAQ